MGKFILYCFIWSFQPYFWLLPRKTAFWMIWQISKIFASILIYSPLKNVIKNNLKLVYGTGNETKNYIRKMCRYIFEIINLGHLNKKVIKNLVSYNHLEKIDQLLKRGEGGIILMLHCGNWELLARSLALIDYPIKAVVNSKKEDTFVQFLDKTRVKNKVKLININTENMFRSALKAFKKNELVVILADTGATDSDKNTDLKFLGKDLPIATGWARMALKSRTPVIAATIRTNNKELTHYVNFSEIIETQEYSNEKSLLEAVLNHYEKFIRENPTEWFLPLSDSETKKTFG